MASVPSAPESGAPRDSTSTRALAERALRAIATAHDLRAQYERVQSQVIDAIGWRDQLRNQYGALAHELRDCIVLVAREERASGRSAAHLIDLLHEILDSAGLDRSTKRDLETEIVEWGIGEYYAA